MSHRKPLASTTHHARHPTTRWCLALSLAALVGCGGGEFYGECPSPAATALPGAGAVLTPADARPVTYGTGASWFSGPLQAAPASVSAEAGQPLWVCP